VIQGTKVWRYQKDNQNHLSLSDLHPLITPFGIFKLLALVSPVPLWFTASDYPFGIFELLSLVSPVPLWFTPSDYPFWNFNLSSCWPLYHLSLSELQLLITLLVSFKLLALVWTDDTWAKSLKDTKRVIRRCKSERDRWYKSQKFEDTQTVGPCITCSSLIYSFWLSFWYLSNLCPLYHLSLSDLHLLITSFGILIFQTFGPYKGQKFERYQKGNEKV
jgi:hypothetical protein